MSELFNLDCKIVSFFAADLDAGARVLLTDSGLEALSVPSQHEERLEWVRKSYERFIEKVREYDSWLGLPELN